MTKLEGKTFAGFEIVAKLGEGGMGAVYKARQSKPDRVVVLKLLESRLASDAAFLTRFKREAAAAAELGHPNLMQIYCVGEHQGLHYVVTEYAEGDTLGERLARRGRLEPREALAITFYAARALLYAWSKAKLAHLDIKPENIFLRKAGDVKVDNLGLARPVVETAAGLPHYTSPEQAQAAREIDFRADIYGLGCTLYHMLTGKTPYEADNAKALLAKHVNEPPPDIAKVWPECPASLAKLLAKMMAKQAGNRHHSYDDLFKELLEVRDEVKRATQQQTASLTKTEGRTFAGYTLLAKLGQDDISVVYKAYQPSPKRFVALRVLASRFSKNTEFVARFKREAASAASLNHPNIVQVYTAGEADGACYVAIEFVEGRTLRQRMERRGQLQPREALAITFYVAQALQHAWNKAKLTHGGLTPDNIILTGSGEVKVGDFGTAKIVETQSTAATQKGAALSSPYYMSPEQGRGARELDCRADIYSLGCMLYHMLTGKTPYDGDDPAAIAKKHVNDPPPDILKAWPTCPAQLAKLMDKMLAKSRRARPQNYDELLADLVKVREEFRRVKAVPPPAPAATAPVPAAPSKAKPADSEAAAEPFAWNRQPVFIAAGIAALVLLSGLLLWAPWKTRKGEGGSAPQPIQSSRPREQRFDDFASRATQPAHPSPSRFETARRTTQEPASTPSAPPPPVTMAIPPQESRAVPTTTTGDTKTSQPPPPPDMPATPRTTVARVRKDEITLDMPSSAAPAGQTGPTLTDEMFEATVPTLPPEEQVRRVVARLLELNPGFNGKETHKIENGVVTELTISTVGTLVPTVGVTDLVPIKSLKQLKKLVIAPPKPNEQGGLSDLSPLKGMALTWLSCQNNPQIRDLSPLNGMPLTVLTCGGTQVSDLTPLAGMRLTTLSINDTPVDDIAPLAGMPLRVFWCNNSKTTDLSPLKGMPLQELRCEFAMARDGPILRGIPTLAKINDIAAATFWKRAATATGTLGMPGRTAKTALDFKSLFNGKDMAGWHSRSRTRPDGWRVRRGAMVNTPPSDDIVTEQQFGNFEFYCEFRVPRRGHSGVFLRKDCKIQIVDDAGAPPSKTCSGSVYKLIAPSKNASKPADTWQALYVKLVGSTVTVILNGKIVIDGRDLSESTSGSFDSDENKPGPIILQGATGAVTFRSIRIKPLPLKLKQG